MYSVKFNCPESRADANGLSRVQVWVNVGSVRKMTYLDYKANPKTFKKELNSKKPNNVNVYCNGVRQRIDSYFISHQSITIDGIIEFIKNGFVVVQKVYTLEDLVNDFISLQQSRAKHEITAATLRKYQAIAKPLYEVISKYTPLERVLYNDILRFKQHLKNHYHYQSETEAGYMKKVKTMFAWAVRNKKITTNPFMDLKITREVKDVISLTIEELSRIEHLNLDFERLERVKDVFLFSCYTGMAFCDVCTFTNADIYCNGSVKYIKRRRKKTNVAYVVPLNDKALAILNKYNYCLPRISNTKINAYLKEIGTLARINKNLHFHLARHTYATLALNEYGVPIEVVSKILGHTNITQTQHYSKVMEQTILSYANNLK